MQKNDEKMLEEISEAEIKEVLSFMTGIPVYEVTESEKHKFLNIDKKLNNVSLVKKMQ